MEQLPPSKAPSRTLSGEDGPAHRVSHAVPMLRPSGSMGVLLTDSRIGDTGSAEETKAIISGVLRKSGRDRQCLLLAAYFMYGDAPQRWGSSTSLSAMDSLSGKQKQICLSDATAIFERETLTIRLCKVKGRETHWPGANQQKVFVAATETDFYLWQAAISRAMALWPGKNARESAGKRLPVNEDTSPLGGLLQRMLRMWTLLTMATNTEVMTASAMQACVQCLEVSGAAPQLHPHAHRSEAGPSPAAGELVETVTLLQLHMSSKTRITKEAFNSILVNALVQLPRLLPHTMECFLTILLEQHSKTMDAVGAKELVEEVAPRLRHVGERFVSITLEYGYDVVTGLWPKDLSAAAPTNTASSSSSPLPTATTLDCVTLFRTWMGRAPTAPWSAVLVITQRYLANGLKEVLWMGSPSRNDPAMPALNGIRNLGNTCYLNSVLQCLMHTPHLVRFFLVKAQRLYVGRDTRRQCLSTVLSQLYTRMYTTGSTLDAAEVANFLIDCDDVAFKKGGQHDAHEALVMILDVLDTELGERASVSGDGADSTASSATRRASRPKDLRGRVSGALAAPAEVLPDYTSDALSEDALVRFWRAAYVRAHNSFVTHYFSGQMVQKITCPHCSASSFCCDSFTYLIAPITPDEDKTNGKAKSRVQLETCLEQTFKPELVDMGSETRCGKCKQHMEAAKRTLELQRLPPYLLICLKRFEIDDSGRTSAKLDAPVLVPEQLSLGSWLRRAAMLPILGEGGNVHQSQMDQAASRRGSYELYAAILHSGSLNSGHYKAVCRVGTSWYEFSDSSVSRLSKYATWSEERAKELYVLFYRSTAGDP